MVDWKQERRSRQQAVYGLKTTIIRLWFVAYFLSSNCPAVFGKVPTAWRDDADLRKVQFVDQDFGWAVGDHGTIWHTQNGGEVWRLQDCGFEGLLSSVAFVDRSIGYVAGGVATPHTFRTKGTLLRTADGGRTWQSISRTSLPWITDIHFVDSKNGYAVGFPTATYPTGAWHTSDAGQTWTPLIGVKGKRWQRLAMVGSTGLVTSEDGTVAIVQGNRLMGTPGPMERLTAQTFIAAMSGQVFLAGGVVPKLTADAGSTWQPLSLPEQMGVFATNTASFRNRSLCLLGAPGSVVLRSADFGDSWQLAATPSVLPVMDVFFLNDSDGWAVGRRGLILTTVDGGQTWKQQRGGAKRMALVGIFADEKKIPWEVLTQAAAQGEYRVHIVVLSENTYDALDTDSFTRVLAAAHQIGASAEMLTRLPVSNGIDQSPSELLANWSAIDENVVNKLSEKLVQLLRIYRPDVVLTDVAETRASSQGIAELMSHLVDDACDYAANPDAFPNQLRYLRLQPWTVSRQLAVKYSDAPAVGLNAPTSLGLSVEDLSSRARDFVTDDLATRRSWTLLARDGKQWKDVGRYAMSGSVVAYDTAQRRPRNIHATSVNDQKKSLQRLQQSKRILRSGKFAGTGHSRAEHIERLLGEEPEILGNFVFELVEHELAFGSRDEAEFLLSYLIRSHPTHAVTDRALQLLVQHRSSVERQWLDWNRRRQMVDVDSQIELASAAEPLADLATHDIESLESNEEALPFDQAKATQSQFTVDVAACFQLVTEIKSKRPDLYNEPSVLFPLAAVSRMDKQVKVAEKFYRRQTQLPPSSVWYRRAQRELSFFSDNLDVLRTWESRIAPSRPFLDGKFSDECWLNATPVRLVNSDNTSTTQVSLAHDDQYLYIAAACAKHPAVEYRPDQRPRPRDADVHHTDRLRFFIDINRDYTSWWKLEIDQRGWTYEALMDDRSWDPKYYVATHLDSEVWQIEAAIPLDELAPTEYRNEFWAFGVERVIPHQGVETWRPYTHPTRDATLHGVLRLPKERE